MSFPNIPNITPNITIDRTQVNNLILASIGLEELGLAHIINSEAEKIQFVIGTLPGHLPPVPPTMDQLMQINRSVERTMRTVIKNQMLLEFKLEDILNVPELPPPPVRPSINITKLISVDGGTTFVSAPTPPGPTLTSPTNPMYRLIVTNTGPVTLSFVTVNDDALGIHTLGGILQPGESFEIPVTGTFALGQQTNTATASGIFEGQTVTSSDTANYFGVMPPAPAIGITKLVSVDNGLTFVSATTPPGPTLLFPTNPMYKLIISNEGNVPLSLVSVNDAKLGVHTVGGTLAVGEFFEIPVTGTFAPFQQTNTATASGVGDGQTVTASDIANYFGVIPSIDVEKSVSPDNGVTWFPASAPPGPVVPQGTNPQFRYTVTNNGTVTLSNIQVTDDKFGPIGSLPSLAAGAVFQFFKTVPWAAGQQVNTATATGDFENQTYKDTETAYYFGI